MYKIAARQSDQKTLNRLLYDLASGVIGIVQVYFEKHNSVYEGRTYNLWFLIFKSA